MIEWILPPKIEDFIKNKIDFIKNYFLSKGVIYNNKNLKNSFKNKRCFILGNAPTIKDIDIKLLKNENVFVMSTFYHHKDYPSLKKTFYSSASISNHIESNLQVEYLKEIDASTKSTETFFFTVQQREKIIKNNLFLDKNVYYISTNAHYRSFDISRLTKSYTTGVIQSLEIAMYMGFKEIFLHSVNLNEICNNSQYDYFFDRKLMKFKDKDVYDNGQVKKDFFELVSGLHKTSNELKEVYDYAKMNGVEVYYTNNESMLKFFKFKKFEDIFKE